MKKWFLMMMTAAAVLVLCACGGSSSSENTKEEEKEPEYAAIGTETDGARSILITNGTEADIKAFVVRSDGDNDSRDNLLAEGEVFAKGETRRFFYDTDSAGKAAEETADAEKKEEASADEDQPEAKETPVEYRIVLTFADDTKKILHQFPMEDAEEAVIKADGKVCFIEYKSMSQKETVSTLESEQAIRQAAIEKRKAKKAAAKKAREEAKAAKEAAAAAKAEAERQAAEAAAAAAAEQQAVQQQQAAQAAAAAQQQQQTGAGGSDNGCLGGDALTY